MTKKDLIQKLENLPDDQFARVAPFLEADLEAIDDLSLLHEEVEAGRQSAATEPVLDSRGVYARVRQSLSE